MFGFSTPSSLWKTSCLPKIHQTIFSAKPPSNLLSSRLKIWVFPWMVVPPNHPFLGGPPLFSETPISFPWASSYPTKKNAKKNEVTLAINRSIKCTLLAHFKAVRACSASEKVDVMGRVGIRCCGWEIGIPTFFGIDFLIRTREWLGYIFYFLIDKHLK